VLVNIPKDFAAYKKRFLARLKAYFVRKDINEAIRIANDSRFGLGASRLDHDAAEQRKFSNYLDAGWCFINSDWWLRNPRITFRRGQVVGPGVSWEPWESGRFHKYQDGVGGTR